MIEIVVVVNRSEAEAHTKKFRKRSGRVVFFDDETSRLLRCWISQREKMRPVTSLFIGEKGGRLKRNGIYSMVLKTEQVGLHDS